MNQVPIDILCEIFVQCAEQEQELRKQCALKCDRSPSLIVGNILSQVSRVWRHTAFYATPQLWRFVHIDLKRYNAAAHNLASCAFLAHAERRFQASGICALEFSCENVGSVHALELIKTVINAPTVACRLERLEIGLTGSSSLPLLDTLKDAEIPRVKDIILYQTGHFTLHEAVPTSLLQSLPSLTSLALVRIAWMAFDVRLEGITSLCLDLCHRQEAIFLNTLGSFPNLQELHLACTDVIPFSLDYEPSPRITLPSLRHISFDPRICHYSLHMLHLPVLNSITARNFNRLPPRFLPILPGNPQIQTLRLENFSPQDEIDINPPNQWTYKSLDTLKSEWTSAFQAGPLGFNICMEGHPEVTNLQITDSTIDEVFFASLLHNQQLLPKLAYLQFSNCVNLPYGISESILAIRNKEIYTE